MTNSQMTTSSSVHLNNPNSTDLSVGGKAALESFATVDPSTLGRGSVYEMKNLADGVWLTTEAYRSVKDPLTGDVFVKTPDTTSAEELAPFIESMRKVPKSGRHNPLKRPDRYNMWGSVCHKAAALLGDPVVFDFFVRLIQRVMPKSAVQAAGEVSVIKKFLENFSGDQPRMLARGFTQAGDHEGQQSHGCLWPYGGVVVIAPFNFPLEIAVLQMIGAALVGNKPVVKSESRVGLPLEQFVRMLHSCGMPLDEIDLLNMAGSKMKSFLQNAPIRMVQFTGGSRAAEEVIEVMKGRVKVEDAGFDWKILGPDVAEIDYVAWQCDQDAYAISGQKCSAQSILFAHSNWVKAGVWDKLKELADRRSFEDLTISPVFSHTNEQIQEHIDKLLKGSPNARVLFGGVPVEGTKVPKDIGIFRPTAVFVPLKDMVMNRPLKESTYFRDVTTELFGPVQVVSEYGTDDLPIILEILEEMEHHLTAAVVSNDPIFLNKVLANTVNGTTYAGRRARTTGAPQNHWFGPAGNPLGAGIGTPEAIVRTWTCHREIIYDMGPVPSQWTLPEAS